MRAHFGFSRERFALVALAFAACTCDESAEPASPRSFGGGGTGGVLVGVGGTAVGGSSGGASGGSGAMGGFDAGPTGIQSCVGAPPVADPAAGGFPPGAKRIPGLDADVDVYELPPEPAPLTWKDCGAGCLELVNTWTSSFTQGLVIMSKGGVVSGKPWAMLSQRLSVDQMRLWIGPVDGSAVRVIGSGLDQKAAKNGFAAPAGIDSAGYLVGVSYQSTKLWMLGAAPPSGKLDCVVRGLMMEAIAFGPARWAGKEDAKAYTGPWPPSGASAGVTPIKLPDLDASTVAAFGDGFALTGYHSVQWRLWFWSPAGGVEPLTTLPPDGEGDYGVAAQGDRVAWLHGSGQWLDSLGVARWKTMELMTAVSDGKLPLKGTSVGKLPSFYLHSTVLLRGDYALTHGSQQESGGWSALLVRISDRRLWVIPPRTPDVIWYSSLYLSDDELALLEKTKKTETPWLDTVVRYKIDSLGPGLPLEAAGDGGADAETDTSPDAGDAPSE